MADAEHPPDLEPGGVARRDAALVSDELLLTGTWEDVSGWWQEHFTDGVDPEYEEQILPLAVEAVGPARRVLEVGTGEGQVARVLAAAGIPVVVGLDPTNAQIVEAERRGGGPVYVRGGADSLPYADGAFDAVAEVARVLEPGGRFVFFLNHPLLQTPGSGWIDDQMLDPPEQYWRIGPYLVEAESIEQVTRGVHIRFVHRPLSRYVNAMAAHGLFIERMEEPAPPTGFLALAPEYTDAATVPRLLLLTASKR